MKKAFLVASLILSLFVIVSFASAIQFSLGDSVKVKVGDNNVINSSDESSIDLTTLSSKNLVITGLGLGLNYDVSRTNNNVIFKPILVKARELYSNGSLGQELEYYNGNKNKIDKMLNLPYGYVMVGYAATTKKTGTDLSTSHISRLLIMARQIMPNGSLGQEIPFSVGDYRDNFEQYVKLPSGYLATGVGGRTFWTKITKLTIDGRKMVVTQDSQPQPVNHAPVIKSVSTQGIYEGDLFLVRVTASDQDNDPIKITYSAPFNSSGMWQTHSRDAGNYRISVTASDGKSTNTITISLSVNQRPANITNQTNITNHAPIINSVNILGHYAGDLFRMVVNATDSDNDQLSYIYNYPFDNSGYWQSNSSSSGNYSTIVLVSDGKMVVPYTLSFIVSSNSNNQTNTTTNASVDLIIANSYPQVNNYVFICNASGFSPLSFNWYFGDGQQLINTSNNNVFHNFINNGTYNVSCTATNYSLSRSDSLTINVLGNITNMTNQTNQTNMTNMTNRAPIIRSLDYSGSEEGDNFRIIVDAYDPDGNSLTITCSQPFGSDCKWRTESGDEGDYDVRVTVSDGSLSTSRTITVTVDQDGSSDSSPSSTINHVGEFQDNNLALNNRLYYDEDVANKVITLNQDDNAYQIGQSTKVSTFISLTIVLLILILVAILAIILALINRRE